MKILNSNNNTPNVLHFHGRNRNELARTFETILKQHDVNADYDSTRLSIVSTWTDDSLCYLAQQCSVYKIPLINCVPDDYDKTQPWYMPNKIQFFLNVLNSINTEYVMFLDGYDVLITQLNDIIQKFESQKYHVLFGPSCNNYPDVKIDIVKNRFMHGPYRYFNAGCVIGYRDDLIKFYTEALEFINISNQLKSEQFVLRHVYAKYSYDDEQDFVGVDYNCNIFQSMGVTDSTIDYNNNTITLQPNVGGGALSIVVTGSEGFIGKRLVEYLKSLSDVKVYCIDKKIGINADSIDYLLATHNIDIVIHLAAQTSVFNDDKDGIINDNIKSFVHICDLCYKYGAKFIYASSSTAKSGNTTSLYGLSKHFNEEYARIYNPYSVGIRFHNVYDFNDPREGTLMWHILNDEHLVLYNNGNNTRHFTYIDDIVKGICKCIFESEPLVNCYNPCEMTIKEFTDLVLQHYGSDKKYECIPAIREHDNPTQDVDTSLKNLYE